MMDAVLVGFLVGVLTVGVILVAYWWGTKQVPPPVLAPTITTASGVASVAFVEDDDDADDDAAGAIVLTERNGAVTIPPEVVSACIAEAKGNHAVMERALSAAADMLAMGMGARDVLVAVQAGDVEPA